MAITKTTDLTNSVKAVYEKKYYMMGLKNPGVWGQFINWESPVAESGGGGSSYDFPIFSEHDLAEDALTEDADITPDGRYVALQSRATNFFADDDPDPAGRLRRGGIFRFDRFGICRIVRAV